MIGDWNFFAHEINAQRCVIAFEMRMRGYDVSARPSWGADDPMLKNAEWLSVFNYSPNEIKKCFGKNTNEIINSAKKIICSFGEGSRAIIWFNWAYYDSIGTHALVAVCDDGTAMFADPQSGLSNVERFLHFAAVDSVKILRVDNLSVNDKVKLCAMNVEDRLRMLQKFGDPIEGISEEPFMYDAKKISLSVEKAISKAEEKLHGKVIDVFDADNVWVFNFDFEVDACLGVKFCCVKNTGVIETFFPPYFPELNKRARKIS